jgi:hypothetical protein
VERGIVDQTAPTIFCVTPSFIQHCRNPSAATLAAAERKVSHVRHHEAQQVADQILRDAPAETEIFFNDDDDATPHYNERRSDKGVHVDGWKAIKRKDGSTILEYNRIMELSKADQLYDKQWDVVDTFFNTNEPEGLGSAVSPDEAKALKTYYFVNAQEQNIYEYRKRLTADNLDLVKKAEAAARKIAIADGMTDEEIEEMFS